MARRRGLLILGLGGAVAAGFAIHGYLTPLTGITGTPGPLLAALGGIALVLAAGLLMATGRGGWRSLLHALVVLALLGVALCGVFLLTPPIWIGALVGAAGFFIYLVAVGAQAGRTPS